jgi:protein-tyrosine-phosphatase
VDGGAEHAGGGRHHRAGQLTDAGATPGVCPGSGSGAVVPTSTPTTGKDCPVPPAPIPAFTVLFVCTGNICRSAIAERLGRAQLTAALESDAGAVRLHSAGTRAVVGSGMHPMSASVARDLGGDPDGFLSRQLTDEHVRSADLVLTMTREHRSAVLVAAPRALTRTFTLREAADLVRLLDDRDLPGEDFAERATAFVRAIAAARARRATNAADDVADPIGGPLQAHRHAGDAIAEALRPVLCRLAALRHRSAQPVHPKA